MLTEVLSGSRVAASLGDAAAQARWATHDAIVGDLAGRLGGTEVDRNDGVLVLFDRRDLAYGFARAYLDALTTAELSARVALHEGALVVRESAPGHQARGAQARVADGLALSVAARVRSLARSGQILATAAARPDVPAVSRGYWRTKGSPGPIELFELSEMPHPDPPEDGPKVYQVVRDGEGWSPARQVANNLPAAWDRLVGREDELRDLADLLEESSLVSVTGEGGVGKTRLAIHHARTHLGGWPGGAWLCDLAEARDVAEVARQVGTELGVASTRIDEVGAALGARGRCLVVLDSFERVVAHADATIGRWRELAPDVRFVVTTRTVLGRADELTLPLGPLSSAHALALFEARAAAVRHGFVVSASEAETVRELLRRLDHLPLAIELAAARMRMMTPRVLLERLDDGLRLLRARQARVARQASLEATFDWSWDLSSPAARAGLVRLATGDPTFAEGAASERLCAPPEATRTLLDELVETSWLRPVPGRRFALAPCARAYLAKKALENP